jgi:serine/threonine protein kinase
MGVVFLATDDILQRRVAVKALKPDVPLQEETVRRFQTEAVTLAKLGHPAITMLYNLIRTDGRLCMIMEYAEGETLESVLKSRGAFTAEKTVHIAIQTLDGLQHAHDRGVIHRDLKPSNLMLSAEGNVKIMDFGIARIAGHSRLTRTGQAAGTPQYMSPEQVRGQEGSHASDVYSLGVVMYELLTGVAPFTGGSEFEIMQAHTSRKPVPPAALNPAIPAALNSAILKALAKVPSQRFASAGEFRQCLQQIADSAAVAAYPPKWTPPQLKLPALPGKWKLPGRLAHRKLPDWSAYRKRLSRFMQWKLPDRPVHRKLPGWSAYRKWLGRFVQWKLPDRLVHWKWPDRSAYRKWFGRFVQWKLPDRLAHWKLPATVDRQYLAGAVFLAVSLLAACLVIFPDSKPETAGNRVGPVPGTDSAVPLQIEVATDVDMEQLTGHQRYVETPPAADLPDVSAPSSSILRSPERQEAKNGEKNVPPPSGKKSSGKKKSKETPSSPPSPEKQPPATEPSTATAPPQEAPPEKPGDPPTLPDRTVVIPRGTRIDLLLDDSYAYDSAVSDGMRVSLSVSEAVVHSGVTVIRAGAKAYALLHRNTRRRELELEMLEVESITGQRLKSLKTTCRNVRFTQGARFRMNLEYNRLAKPQP